MARTVDIDEAIGHPDLESDRKALEELRAEIKGQQGQSPVIAHIVMITTLCPKGAIYISPVQRAGCLSNYPQKIYPTNQIKAIL